MAEDFQNPGFWKDAKVVEVHKPDYWADAKVVTAPHNAVFDQANSRVVALPQTLNAKESEFLIRRDADGVKDFFAMEETGGITALGHGLSNFVLSLPQAAGALAKEQGELAGLDRRNDNISRLAGFGSTGKMLKAFQMTKDMFVRSLGSDQVVEKSQALIDRNKKYVAENGFERPKEGGLSGLMFDLGQGGGSVLASMGVTVLTRDPTSAAIVFFALQKASVYEEARAAGKDVQGASDISTLAGTVEGALEFVGGGALLKALRGNTAVKGFVASGIAGMAIEGTQEGAQATAEEAITQLSGVREKEITQTVKDILYQAALGGIIGGVGGAVMGQHVEVQVKAAGVPDDEAKKLREYVEKNIGGVGNNLTEFIDKELAPIAADNESAQKFISLMQKFGNDQEVVNRDELSPDERKVYDQFIAEFNAAKFDARGVGAVEKRFFDTLKAAGVGEEQAVAGAKIMGARADAVSRALGVSPEEWLKSKGVVVRVEGDQTQLDRILDHIRDTKRLAAPKKQSKTPILSMLKKRGGLRSGGVAEAELKHMGITPQTHVGLFKKEDLLRPDKAAKDIDNLEPESFKNATGIDPEVTGGYVDRDWLLEQIRAEASGQTGEIDVDEAYMEDVIRELDERGMDAKDFTNEQIAAILSQPRDEMPFYQGDRGSITFKDGGAILDLFKGQNESTLFHELGHLFLRDMQDVAKATKRPRVKADYEAVKKWLGAKGDTFTVAQEEKFARGFELYLREGKAPKPELQSVFDKFKQWLERIYRAAEDLNVEISPEIRDVFNRMLGGDFVQATQLKQEQFERDRARDYEIVANTPPEKTLKSDTGAIFRDMGDIIGDVMTPISTRLGKISQELKHAVRQFVFNTGLHVREDSLAIKPFVSAASKKMTPEDYRILDLALKNRDGEKVDFLISKYDLKKEYQAVRDTLDDLYNQAQEVGLDMGYIEDYFPRAVRKGMAGEYIADMRGEKEWTDIQLAMKEADPNNEFTQEEKAAFVNSYLRGYQKSHISLAASGHTKERTVSYITPHYNKYYDDSMQTLISYVSGVRHGIEERRFFGKKADEAEDSIGAFVLGLVENKAIEPQEEAEVRRLLKAVIEPKGPGKFLGWARDAAYIYTMGSPISAITQIQDLAWSLYKNGAWRTGGSVVKYLTGRTILTKEELGLDRVMEEFADKTRSSNAVRNVFRATGLTFMDNMGKQTFIDASYGRLIRENKKNSKEFQEYMDTIFGERAEQVKWDLGHGNITDEVKYLLFSELSDFQPISIAEMPLGYAVGGNLRVLYMLKSYTVKMFDIYRREAFDHIGSREPKRVVKGVKNLTHIAIALMLMGLPTDALKDFLLGSKTEFDDMVFNNILRLFGISKYQIYKAKRDGYARTAAMTLLPPFFSITDDVIKDAVKVGTGEIAPKDSQTLSHVPIGGKFYYWWWGGGQAEQSGKTVFRP